MGWSMKTDRQLIKLARESSNIESLAKKLGSAPAQILKASRRLGISLGPQPPRPDGRFKAKSK
jgi:transcriptional regulator with GAF, ATPase, and Fis domain